MVIVPRYLCRLGNNLFQYCFPRLVAERLGYRFSAPPLLKLETNLPGKEFNEPEQLLTDVNGIPVQISEIFSRTDDRKIVMEGFFQQADKFIDHRDTIRKWLKTSLHFDPPYYKTIGIHIRLYDYTVNGWAIPASYYCLALDEVLGSYNPDNIMIFSDGQGRELDAYLRPVYSKFRFVILHRGDPLEAMESMLRCPILICANSSFSWWPAFLGHHEGVWMPYNYQPWGESQAGDAIMPRGYIYQTDLRVPDADWHVIDMKHVLVGSHV